MSGVADELTTSVPASDPRAAADGLYVLVVDGNTSWKHVLSPDGSVTIGRAPDCSIVVQDTSVSRHHARIETTGGRATMIDLGGQNGTLVNQQPTSRQELVGGDVVALGTVLLVFHGPHDAGPRLTTVTAAELRALLVRELERVVDYGRELAVIHVHTLRPHAEVESALAAIVRRIDLVAWRTPHECDVLLPESGLAHVEESLARLLASLPDARFGYARAPTDGSDADTILGGARVAAATTATGTRSGVDATTRIVALGDRELVLADPAMARVYSLVERLAVAELAVLITGETGTGKELIATAIHTLSPRHARPRIAINCAALPETLIESELFGHERGAFSGATATKPGLFEQALGGTVFLDEIAELSLGVQAKLLRALETRRVLRIGDVREREVDFRLISATNRELKDAVAAGTFRSDLYYRLTGATIWLPPLRDRPRELLVLAARFVAQACARSGRVPLELTRGALQRLALHAWPGNVRELKNVADYLAATAPPAATAVHEWEIEDALDAPRGDAPAAASRPASSSDGRAFRPIADELDDLERTRVAEALQAAGGNQTRAARLIAMPLRTFLTRLKKYRIDM